MLSGTESKRGIKFIPRLAIFNPGLAIMGFPETRAWAVIAVSEFVLVFVCLQAVLNEQMKQYLSLLRQLKDYDEELSHEVVLKAFQEQERQKLEVLFFLTMFLTLENLNKQGSPLFPFHSGAAALKKWSLPNYFFNFYLFKLKL